MLFKLLLRLLTPPRIFFRYLTESLRITNENLIPVMTVNLFFGLVAFFTYFSLMFLVFRISYERFYQNILLGYLGIPAVTYFLCGLLRFYLSLVRKSKINLELWLIDFRKFLQMFFLFIIYYSLYVLYIKILDDFREFEGIIQIRVVLGAGVFAWIIVRMIFAPFFVIDRGYTVRKALRSSLLLTSGRTVKTFFLLLAVSVPFFPVLAGLYVLFNGNYAPHIIIIGSFLFSAYLLYFFAPALVALVLSFDIYLKNRFSRRRKLINEAAVDTKKQLEDSGIFTVVNTGTGEGE